MGQTTFQWTFQVLKGLTKQVILGSDFLGRNKALIDFREATLRVGKHVFQMEGRDKTASECYLLKTLGRVELKPQASTLFPCKVSSQVPSGSYLVRMIDTAEGFCDQPGIAIANAVVQVTDSTQVNILAVNETGGRQVIPRHAVIATLEIVPESDIDSITVVPDLDRVADAQPQAVDLDVENAQQLSDLIDRYPDVFANSDLDLGSTDLVECNINTGDTALKKFRQYLLGAQFVVYTDHKPLRSLFTSEMKNARIQRWGILISEFNCEIKYREGKSMKADFVSRIRGPNHNGRWYVWATQRDRVRGSGRGRFKWGCGQWCHVTLV